MIKDVYSWLADTSVFRASHWNRLGFSWQLSFVSASGAVDSMCFENGALWYVCVRVCVSVCLYLPTYLPTYLPS